MAATKRNSLIVAAIFLIHHLTLWQRAYVAGRNRGNGRREMYLAVTRCAPVLFGQIRYNEAPEIQVPFRL